MTNTGNAALTFSSAFTFSGDFGFGGSGTCAVGVSYAPGASCTVGVVFTPTAEGTRTGTLTINSNAANTPQILSLTGMGVVTATPTTVPTPTPLPTNCTNCNNYYVSPTGSDSSAGTQAAPWKTINHADSTLQLGAGGTIVHVSPGTYSEA